MWKNAKSRSDKKTIILTFAEQFGVSKETIYDRFREIENGVSRTIVAGYSGVAQVRKTKSQLEEEKAHMMTIALIKRGGKVGRQGYGVSTDLAITAAENEGLIPRGKYTRSTADRLLNQLGISTKLVDTPSVATELISPYPNHCWFVDATVKNHYFLNIKKERIDFRSDIKYDSSHGMDILEKHSLKRIWDYFIVDNYSKCYLMMTFAPDPKTAGAKHGGENTADWIAFLTYAMLAKSDSRIPIQGIPKLIFCDEGSGLNSNHMKSFLGRLGIEVRTHLPGRASAKGAVEARVGAYKRSFGVTINKNKIYSLDELRNHDSRYLIFDNNKKGGFQKWVDGTKENPITKASQKNIQDALVTETEKVITAYGTIRIDNQQFFVSPDLPRGTKVVVFTNSEGNRCVQSDDGRIFQVRPYGKIQRDIETYEILDDLGHEIRQTELQILRKQIQKVSREFKEKIRSESYLRETNITYFPPQGEEAETHVAMAPSKIMKIDEAITYVFNETGFTADEIGEEDLETMREVFGRLIDRFGEVPTGSLYEIVNIYLGTGTND
ncbi:DDE-type integrase/transposase/recombinase [Leptospira ellisii]|uniref:Integrase n=1 Tax=Leptospira ellisii TaxID=2023197 RepID=A0A2N0B7Y6_9LEPT|nr:DDE-type integrase/transposase/recombinase [Leptospira ellisii]MDV6237835.1 DDE-type integrase/transposase/recombinase [Leptospira ellisii]PJZ92598.1 integrase [Leptospira ellisii]PKA04774.1 integrase [Leptospira ellisii]